MAEIVLADDGVAFDGRMAQGRPLGGAESAVVGLVEALARRGHRVTVANQCAEPLDHRGVAWRRLQDGLPQRADLYIANRGDRLLPLLPKARARVFWLHNPARYVLKPRYLLQIWRWRPTLVFAGRSHAAGYPGWAPGRRAIIPLGIDGCFRAPPPRATPPARRAIFASQPLRGLDWLLALWQTRIRPALADAELHLYTGAETYAGALDRRRPEIAAILAKADATPGVVRHAPVAKPDLAARYGEARVMLYRGDPGESFCLAVAEAQAAGLPAVVQPIAATPERVIDGVTGFVAGDEAGFAAAAIRLLGDDALWQAQHRACIARQRGWGWDEAAQQFEALIPGAAP
jgi:glycosyltransferase involved in cell wall biosynthesis